MRLKEFIDKNGNQVKINKTTSTVSKTSSGFKKRFEKLLGYAKKHPGPEVMSVCTQSISEDGFFYTERKRRGLYIYDYDIHVYIGPQTEAWRLRVYEDNTLEEDISGMGYVELLKALRRFITIPTAGTPEYKDLVFEDSKDSFLKEFVDKNGNKVNLKNSSSKPATNSIDDTYRFERLVAQIKADKLCDIRVHGLTGSVLAFTTDRFVVVRIERKRSFPPYVLQIGNHADAYADYEDVLGALIEEGIIANTDLCESLEEWVDASGNKIVLNKTSTSAPTTKSNKEKFEELVKYIEKYQVPYSIKVEASCSDAGFYYSIRCAPPGINFYTVSLQVYHSRITSSWIFRTYRSGVQIDDASGKGWEELLLKLRTSEFGDYVNIPKPGSKEYESLTESVSFAEDFQVYENLWD